MYTNNCTNVSYYVQCSKDKLKKENTRTVLIRVYWPVLSIFLNFGMYFVYYKFVTQHYIIINEYTV